MSDQLQPDSHGGKSHALCVAKGDDNHGAGIDLSIATCTGAPNQRWTVVVAAAGSVVLEQNGSCITNNYFDRQSSLE